MSKTVSLVWFRADLRLSDHPALAAAAHAGAVVPVFVWAPDEEGKWPPGAASRWWQRQSLRSLDTALRRLGSRLILARGPTVPALLRLAGQCGARALFFNRRYEPAARKVEVQLTAAAEAAGLRVAIFNSALLYEPGQLVAAAGQPYRRFTPFWHSLCAAPEPPRPLPAPDRLQPPRRWPEFCSLEELGFSADTELDARLSQFWQPGEAGAETRLGIFLRERLAGYPSRRNLPAQDGTSRLSPHLHFGEISPRRVWHAVRRHSDALPGAQVFLRELAWREFAYHFLIHFPHTPEAPLDSAFTRLRTRRSASQLVAWQQGVTGYPLVDAGMRELLTTGWMHNRVRMVVASFLTKHLLQDWQDGARWFWERLVDADLANNTLNWQWVAGCGADTTPYFRIFNPVLQARRFDPAGEYVRRWVPELAALDSRWIHRPWQALPQALAAAGVKLGRTYPRPIVDHNAARARALAAFAALRRVGKR
ncbi:MAG: DNA photolyase family protein [Firmicutes bacterium]|nr:DNA photolyase family protein [Bacillota bacterium]